MQHQGSNMTKITHFAFLFEGDVADKEVVQVLQELLCLHLHLNFTVPIQPSPTESDHVGWSQMHAQIWEPVTLLGVPLGHAQRCIRAFTITGTEERD